MLRGGDSVRVISLLMMTDDTGDVDGFAVATAAHSQAVGFGCWL